MYGLADDKTVVVRHLYQQSHPGRRRPDNESSLSIHRRLCEHGNFITRLANRGRPRPMTAEVKVDVLEVVK
jgi:hypothetical protein